MSRLTDLIEKAKAEDPQLGADLEREFRALSSRLPFGLNFERHQPEAVELPRRPVRRGDKVRVLPPRGETTRGDQRLWEVKRLIQKASPRLAELESIEAEPERTTHPVEDMVVVAAFGDTIYPGLVSTGCVDRGGDRPYHTVINGENYHALKALTWTHRGKVDAIYIDPPYNTRDKDWKYNNDYVNKDDLYRHSKWLAMMERRLVVARELLNPYDSVLIVTIDEKEYLRLGLLLEQVFPEARIQMVTTVISQRGVARDGSVSRVDEYLFLLQFGNSRFLPLDHDLLGTVTTKKKKQLWYQFRRNGAGSLRRDSPNLFFPLIVDPSNNRIVDVGMPLPIGVDRKSYVVPEGYVAVWPLRSDGTEARWRTGRDIAKRNVEQGYLRVGAKKKNSDVWSVLAINEGGVQAIESGEVEVLGRNSDGSLQLRETNQSVFLPKSVWNYPSHDAGWHGSRLLSWILPNRRFPYPKSVYAVEDVLSLSLMQKPEAVILDFFAGSGTTAHAVMRLNKRFGGRRQCISVTNNEVSADEQVGLRSQGLRPGDSEWEKLGICEYITKPRVESVITGKTPEGDSIEGDYQFGNSVEKEKPRSFKQIGFADVNQMNSVAKKKQLVALVEDMSQSLVRDPCPFIVSEEHTSSILFDVEFADAWMEALEGQEHITNFYIVTPVKRIFDALKTQVTELLGPLIENEVESLPIADGFEANAEFFTLTYETPVSVNYQTAFSRIAPLLWMRAGCEGDRIDKVPLDGWEVVSRYGLLTQVDASPQFLKAVRKAIGLRIAFIVTDDERRFQAIARKLPDHIEAIRLYESYLTNFAFANGESE